MYLNEHLIRLAVESNILYIPMYLRLTFSQFDTEIKYFNINIYMCIIWTIPTYNHRPSDFGYFVLFLLRCKCRLKINSIQQFLYFCYYRRYHGKLWWSPAHECLDSAPNAVINNTPTVYNCLYKAYKHKGMLIVCN